VYRSERYGQGKTSFSYNIPVSNGSYNVNLDFAESYVTGPGQRIFNVSINGTQVLNNFDIYAAAGGMNIPVVKTFNVAVTNGTLNINFLSGSVENPKVNGIEVLPVSVSSSVRINAGATTSYTDNNGNAWLADQLVTGRNDLRQLQYHCWQHSRTASVSLRALRPGENLLLLQYPRLKRQLQRETWILLNPM